MTNFWLIRTQNAAVEGPFTGPQLKHMAREGSIRADALIADDNGRWVAASRVEGLCAESPAQPRNQDSGPQTYGLEAPPPSAKAPPVIQPVSPMPSTTLSGLAHPRPNEYGFVEAGRVRSVVWYLAASIALAAIGVVTIAANAYEAMHSKASSFWEAADEPWMLSDTLSCVGVVGYLVLWGFWVAWLYSVHDEVRRFTQGEYSISPGKAIGLCFIPLFNLFWQVYAPYRLAQFVESCLRQAAQREAALRPNTAWAGAYPLTSLSTTVAPGTVLAFQIVGAVPGCLIGACRALFFGLTMRHIQRGLNQVWEGHPQP